MKKPNEHEVRTENMVCVQLRGVQLGYECVAYRRSFRTILFSHKLAPLITTTII